MFNNREYAERAARTKTLIRKHECGGSEKNRFGKVRARPARTRRLGLGAGVLGDRLRAFAHGVLGQLAGQKQTNGRLDLPAGDGRTLVVVSQARRFGGDALEDIVDEAVHDAHRLAGNAGVGVHLLQHLVDVDGITFLPPALLLLVALADVLLGLAGLLGRFTAGFRWHDCDVAAATAAVGLGEIFWGTKF